MKIKIMVIGLIVLLLAACSRMMPPGADNESSVSPARNLPTIKRCP
jgi:hypothetical protein